MAKKKKTTAIKKVTKKIADAISVWLKKHKKIQKVFLVLAAAASSVGVFLSRPVKFFRSIPKSIKKNIKVRKGKLSFYDKWTVTFTDSEKNKQVYDISVFDLTMGLVKKNGNFYRVGSDVNGSCNFVLPGVAHHHGNIAYSAVTNSLIYIKNIIDGGEKKYTVISDKTTISIGKEYKATFRKCEEV